LGVEDVLLALTRNTQEKNPRNFSKYMNGNRLTEVGLEDFRNLYSLLESLLCARLSIPIEHSDHILMQWPWRKSLLELVEALQIELDPEFPVVLSQRCVAPLHTIQSKLFILIESWLINSLSSRIPDCYFTDPSFGYSFPLTMALLGKPYIESYLTLCLTIANSNKEENILNLSQLFSKESGQENFSVIQATFVPLSFTCTVSDLPCVQIKTQFSITGVPFVIVPGAVYAATKRISAPSRRGVYCAALTTILSKNHMEWSTAEAKNFATRLLSHMENKEKSELGWKVTLREFSFENCALPSEVVAGTSEIYFLQTPTESDTIISTMEGTPQKPTKSEGTISVCPPKMWEENEISDRINKGLLHVPPFCKDTEIPTCGAVNVKDGNSLVYSPFQKTVGNVAEFVVFKLLQKTYPGTFTVTNWVSSARLEYFPEMSRNLDDAAGYDFVFEDVERKFMSEKFLGLVTATKKKFCYMEVKGCSAAWDGTFHMSANERWQAKALEQSDLGYYVIVVVENCSHFHLTRVVAVISWDDHSWNFTPEGFLVTKKAVGEPKLEWNPNPVPQKPGVYVPPHRRYRKDHDDNNNNSSNSHPGRQNLGRGQQRK
jgi:hypothetical protein